MMVYLQKSTVFCIKGWYINLGKYTKMSIFILSFLNSHSVLPFYCTIKWFQLVVLRQSEKKLCKINKFFYKF